MDRATYTGHHRRTGYQSFVTAHFHRIEMELYPARCRDAIGILGMVNRGSPLPFNIGPIPFVYTHTGPILQPLVFAGYQIPKAIDGGAVLAKFPIQVRRPTIP